MTTTAVGMMSYAIYTSISIAPRAYKKSMHTQHIPASQLTVRPEQSKVKIAALGGEPMLGGPTEGLASQTASKKEKKCILFGAFFTSGSKGAFFIESEADFLDYEPPSDFSTGEGDCFHDYCHLDDDEYLDYYVTKSFRRKPKVRSRHRAAQHKVWPQEEIASKKDNIEKRLALNHIERRGLPELAQREANEGNPTPVTQFSLSGAKERKKERWSKSHSPPFIQSQDAPAVLKNSITENSAAVSTASFLRDFVDLQHREITPEDYELLLQLDELVKKKMVSKAALDSFTVFTAEEGLTCEQCAVCLEQYCTGQELKQLPCSHFFHKDCIEQWLSTVSMNCPLDGLPV